MCGSNTVELDSAAQHTSPLRRGLCAIQAAAVVCNLEHSLPAAAPATLKTSLWNGSFRKRAGIKFFWIFYTPGMMILKRRATSKLRSQALFSGYRGTL